MSSWPRAARPMPETHRVRCEDCANFLPWPDNPTVAMGRCGDRRHNPSPREPLLWPAVERICNLHRPKESES